MRCGWIRVLLLLSWDPLHFLNKMEMSITIALNKINDKNEHISKIGDIS